MKQRILIVDDELPVCEMVADYLGKHGYEVATANAAATAHQLLEQGEFQLMISDIDINGDDGLELLAAVKQSHPALPIIMMTGMGFDDELMGEALRKKASAYVSKTLPLPTLLTEVHRVLRREAAP